MVSRIPAADGFNVELKVPLTIRAELDCPDITVVTVVFNAVKSGRATEFCQCLDSVQTQRGVNIEHLIVDGGSRDGTREIIMAYENARVPIRLFSAPDHGLYEAMNRGIALARGKYVVFLNSDDYFSGPYGMLTSKVAIEESGADYSYAPVIVTDDAGKPVKHSFVDACEQANMLRGMTICHQSIITKRSVLVELDGFDLSYRSASDYDFFLRMIYAGYRGVRVGSEFVTFRLGGFSYGNAALSENEVDSIFKRLILEHCGEEYSHKQIRAMRITGEYPVRLSTKILSIASQSFVCKLVPRLDSLQEWSKRTRWQLYSDLRSSEWEQFEDTTMRSGVPKQIMHVVRFAVRRPRDMAGSLKAWVLRNDDSLRTLKEYCQARCCLRTDLAAIVFPQAELGTEAANGISHHGVVCQSAYKTSVSLNPLSHPDAIFVKAFACAYEEHDRTADVYCNGQHIGRIALYRESKGRGDRLRISRGILDSSSEVTVEIVVEGGGDFVFGGLAVV